MLKSKKGTNPFVQRMLKVNQIGHEKSVFPLAVAMSGMVIRISTDYVRAEALLLTRIGHYSRLLLARVIIKSGVYAFKSSGDLINFCHLNTVFEFDSGYHLR
ncbi:MAG: hypothetical protein KZQ62_13200, partial [Candidatus Thiodiazotropha sp. (ex Lucinoma aequizonata)]|nr:hypothetical protein [Candidatus Thiodiazotropha sp. (ex Lucinoma aequizonata)]